MSQNNVPCYYVEQPAEMLVGPWVTRLAFGLNRNDDSEFPTAVVEIAIPTHALMSLVSDLQHIFEGDKFKHDAKIFFQFMERKIDAGLGVGPSKEIVRAPHKAAKKAPPRLAPSKRAVD